MNGLKKLAFALCGIFFMFTIMNADACSRFTYLGPENTVITGRSMDWLEDVHTDLWAFPAGMKRSGSNQKNSLTWTSKYGSVIASGYNIATTDGINTQGLDVNLLYLSPAKYPNPQPNQQNLSVLAWAQYILDNYATVDEAVKNFSEKKLNIVAPPLPNGASATVHLSITDKSGDNAVFEYLDGKLVVHHGKQYRVMTNEPPYDKQLALNDYWQNLQGKFLPGTGEPEDRFVRASYYLNIAPQTDNPYKAVAIAFSIIRNVSVPMNAPVSATRPNVASTIWVSVADLKNRVYYFQNTDRPNIFWVDLKKLNLKPGALVMKLPLANGQVYAGEVSKHFVPSKAFIIH